jgi:NAD(P)-dependent dehydrogenase (short-subunit alcohol dehydrogenase family)
MRSSTSGALRTVAITGAAGSLAGSTAEVFARAGWNLGLIARERHLHELYERHPSAEVVGSDLADPADAGRALARIEARFGSVDALLNLTGGFAVQSATDVEPADLQAMLDANLSTVVFATRAALRGMLARGQGFVLGVAAAQPLRGGARVPAYAAAKGAVLGYLRSLRSEVEPKGIGVSVLVPMGAIDTPENRAAMPNSDPSRWIDGGELAEAIHFLATRGPRARVNELRVSAG